MKTKPSIALYLAGLLLGSFGAPAVHAGLFSDSTMEMVAVAEAQSGQPSNDNSLSYTAFDGGYIEAGDAIAGESPPTPDAVRQALYDALDHQGYKLNQAAPSLVVTYNWGVIRIDHREIRLPYNLRRNLVARINLVSTDALAADAENHILGRKRSGDLNPNASAEPLLVGPAETALERAREPRYFIVVSAYDYQSVVHNEPRLVWRTKLSAIDKSGYMEQVIPALILGGGQFLGKNLPAVQDLTVPLTVSVPQNSAAAGINASPESSQLDKRAVDTILQREHGEFSGANMKLENNS